MNRRTMLVAGLANAGIVAASAAMIGLAPAAFADSSDPYPPVTTGGSAVVPVVQINTTNPVAGSSAEVAGAGFLPGEQVSIDFHSTVIHLATVTADSSGTGRASITVPNVTGDHHITLTGVQSGRVDSIAVTVRSANTPAAQSVASAPANGSLAYTGAAVIGMGVLGAGLLAGGAGLVLSGRRRDAEA